MIRFLVSAALFFGSAAIGLLVANAVLDGMTIANAGTFFVVVAIFALLQAILTPFFVNVTRKNASALLSAVGLITTFVSLFITTLVTDGLTISGMDTWFLGALIVWLGSMVASLILPLILVKKAVRNRNAAS